MALPQPGGTLQVLSGAASGARFDIEAAPATIGTAPECWVRLPTGDGVAPLHARLWWRDGKPMLHHIAAGYQTRVNGQAVVWASLEPGTEILLGTVALRFTPPAEDVAPHVDSAVSDLDARHAPEALRPGA
ncbi:MAG: FHA domain-containing protein [Dehalococcoidia bacterium]